MTRKLTRRHVLATSTTALMASGFVRSAQAAPEASRITPELVEAAKKEGKIVWYTSVDLTIAERVAKVFEDRYPGLQVKVERSGAERNYQRIGQEYREQDLQLRRREQLRRRAPHHLEAREAAGRLRARGRGARFPGGAQGSRRHVRLVAGDALADRLHTKLVKKEDAPRSFADLLDPKWRARSSRRIPATAAPS